MKRISTLTTKTSIARLGLALLLAASAPGALADSASWTGTTDGDWQNTNNWGAAILVPGAGEVATFDGTGNGNTAITNIQSISVSNIVFNPGAAAYTLTTTNNTWVVPNGGGIIVNGGVTADQNLSGITFIRLTNGTVNVVNQGTGLLKVGTFFNANSVSSSNMRIRFAPTNGSTIEIVSGKNIDNGSTAGRTTSVLVDDAGTVRMNGIGNFIGKDAEGNALTIHQGTFSFTSIAASGRTAIGLTNRIQFGEAGTNRTATLQLTGNVTNSTDRPFHIIDNNTAVFDITNALANLIIISNITQSASTLGGGNLTKAGAGTLTLAGTNLYSGVTFISAGTLYISNNFALTNSTFDPSSPGTLVLDSAVTTPAIGGLKGSANFTLPTNVTSLTLNPISGKTTDYAGTLDGGTNSSMSLIKAGAGTQTLSGSNAFTGNVTINAGTLKLANNHALGAGTKALSMQGTSRVLALSGGITLSTNITMFLSSNSGDGGGVNNVDGDNVIEGPMNISTGNPALNISSASGTLTISGKVTLTAPSRPLLLGGASTGTNVISGVISQNGASGNSLPVTKQGTTTWLLAGANTHNGDTLVNAGTLILSNNLALQNSAFDTSGAGALVLDPSVTTPTFGGLKTTNNNSLTLPATVTSLTLNTASNAAPVYTNALSGGTAMSLTKTGLGTQTLGGLNSYSGNTTVSAGTLSLGGTGSLPNSPLITVNSNSVLDVSGTAFVLGAAQTLAGSGSINGDVTVNGTLIPGSSVGTLTFSNNLTINSNLVFELDKSLVQSNDVIQVIGTLNNTGNGTLTVSNLGPALVAGDKFTLFNQAVPNGQNLTIVPPAGVTFTNQLATDGSITVLTVPSLTPPTLTFTNLGAGSLQFSWTGSYKLQSQTNTLGTGLGTNWGDYPGGNSSPVNVTVDPAQPSVFFRLAQP